MANEESTQRNVSPKLVLALVLVLILAVLAVVNSQKVKIDAIADDVSMPLFVVIVGSAVISCVGGWFIGRYRA